MSREWTINQIKSFWPILVFCCAAYGMFQVKSQKLEDTAKLASDTAVEVSNLRTTLQVHGQMLADIRDAVHEIRKHH